VIALDTSDSILVSNVDIALVIVPLADPTSDSIVVIALDTSDSIFVTAVDI